MMGAGKSTVGRIVAERLGKPFVDTDEEVERVSGATVAAVFALHGEAEFRRRESQVLAEVLAGAPGVVAVGGGAVLDPANRAAMHRAGTVLWLRARPATLARRVGRGQDRPLLAGEEGGPGAAVARIDAERRPLYAEVADEVLDVDDLDADAVAERVLALPGLGTGDRP